MKFNRRARLKSTVIESREISGLARLINTFSMNTLSHYISSAYAMHMHTKDFRAPTLGVVYVVKMLWLYVDGDIICLGVFLFCDLVQIFCYLALFQ